MASEGDGGGGGGHRRRIRIRMRLTAVVVLLVACGFLWPVQEYGSLVDAQIVAPFTERMSSRSSVTSTSPPPPPPQTPRRWVLDKHSPNRHRVVRYTPDPLRYYFPVPPTRAIKPVVRMGTTPRPTLSASEAILSRRRRPPREVTTTIDPMEAELIEILAMGYLPEFERPMENITATIGRDVALSCSVKWLGGHRIGWVKTDTRALQAVSMDIITSNSRVWVSHSDTTTWNLHIRTVREEDRGRYMCQVNTNPMMRQEAYLNVIVPPDFIAENTSSDVIVPEDSTVQLTCKAKGDPDPTITWRREDNSDIILKDSGGMKYSARSYVGDVLTLTKVSRHDMGVYLCIASNGVPPSISKRILLGTIFPPAIKVPNQLIGAPRGSNVSMECLVEAYPRSINVWVKDTGVFNMLVASPKYAVQEVVQSMYVTKMVLTVRDFQKEDVGTYVCLAKSSRGESDEIIRLYEIPGPKRKLSTPRYDQNEITVGRDGGGSHPVGKGGRVIDDNDEQQQHHHHQHKGDSAEDGFDAGKEAIDDITDRNHHHLSSSTSVDHPKSVNSLLVAGGGGGGGGGGAAGKSHLPTTKAVTHKPTTVRNAPDGLGDENAANPSRHDTVSAASSIFMEYLYQRQSATPSPLFTLLNGAILLVLLLQ